MVFSPRLLATLCFSLFTILDGRVCGSKGEPTATLRNGTYYGLYNPSFHQDFFPGMLFAKKPKRFAVAEGLDLTWRGKQPAIEYPRHCHGYGADQIGYQESEDCLYINVIRPAGISKDPKYPVAAWIHGCGLAQGGSGDARYNMSFFVEDSVAQGTPTIGVSFNYPLSVFGFLNGKEAQDAGLTNIGFRGQRLALRWLNENIGPLVVTKTQLQSLASLQVQNLSPPRFLLTEASTTACFEALPHSQDLDRRSLARRRRSAVSGTSPFEDINKALNYTDDGPGTWVPVKDGDFLVDYFHNQLARGEFTKVPILIGPTTMRAQAALVKTEDPMAEGNTGKPIVNLVDEVMCLYPYIRRLGIPSLEEWPHVIQAGDEWMQYSRRRADLAWSDHDVKSYSYSFDVQVYGNNLIGSTHFHEVAFVFNNLNGNGYATNPFVDGDAESIAQAKALSEIINKAWINFFVSQDPNFDNTTDVAWPAYNAKAGGLSRNMVLDLDGAHVEWDDHRVEGIN